MQSLLSEILKKKHLILPPSLSLCHFADSPWPMIFCLCDLWTEAHDKIKNMSVCQLQSWWMWVFLCCSASSEQLLLGDHSGEEEVWMIFTGIASISDRVKLCHLKNGSSSKQIPTIHLIIKPSIRYSWHQAEFSN